MLPPPDLSPSISDPQPLGRLLKPRSIAIVGASTDPRSFGAFVLGNLERFGYRESVHLVSRSNKRIGDRPCVSSIEELPEGIDLAVLAVPAEGALDAVRTLGARRAGAAVLFASGYSESGDEGRLRQQRLSDAAREAGVLLVGPNCMGFTNFEAGIPVTFEPVEPYPCNGRPGVAVLAQSGAMAANLRDSFIGRGQPITLAFSTGNEALMGLEDVLAHLIADPQTTVIAMYAEQIRRPGLFLELAARARQAGKPIVLLMPGRSARAREAAQSHTGALAGDRAVAVTMLEREAVVVVDSLDELFDATAILARFPRPVRAGPAFMTGSGAIKNITLDFADQLDLDLPPLADSTVQRLTALLPGYAVAENPLDYTTISVRNPGLIGQLIDTMLADRGIGSLVMGVMGGPPMAQRDKADHLLPTLARADKPAILAVLGDDCPLEPFFVQAIRDSGVPFFRSVDRALRALARVTAYGKAVERAARFAQEAPAPAPLPGPVPVHGAFPEYQGKHWLAKSGVPIPRSELARDVDEAIRIAKEIGYPIVLKAQAGELAHKSDVGAVLVGIGDEAALRSGWQRLVGNVARHRPNLRLDGVLVEAMGARGLEMVVGARRDPEWGPVLLVGMGGIWIEVLKDVRLLAADMAESDITDDIRRLRSSPLFSGVRGAAPVDVDAVARVATLLGQQMLANPQIAEIDINPLVAYEDGVLALDALLVCQPSSTLRQDQ